MIKCLLEDGRSIFSFYHLEICQTVYLWPWSTWFQAYLWSSI